MITRKQSGFSLVELILSIVVGVGFITALNVIVNDYVHLGQYSRDLILANSYVEGKVEALRGAGYNSLNDGTTDLATELPAQLHSPKSGSMTISAPSAGIKQVDISVSYNNQGSTRTYTYRTYIGELGVGQ
jgi:hypothetical protein